VDAGSTDIASNRSIVSFRKLRGKFQKWQDTLLLSDILAFASIQGTPAGSPYCQ
jgi:hypothetical protein